jgi:flavin reductase (DIM6/NTAB) family NADH-FMN oxidoreductase RutF
LPDRRPPDLRGPSWSNDRNQRFECRTHQCIAAGDRILFLGAVQRFQYRDGAPLVLFASRYGLPSAEGLVA